LLLYGCKQQNNSQVKESNKKSKIWSLFELATVSKKLVKGSIFMRTEAYSLLLWMLR